MSGFRTSDQTITTVVMVELHSRRPLPRDRIRDWLQHGIGSSAISLHSDDTYLPGEQGASEEGWEYAYVDLDDGLRVLQEPS